MLTPSKYSLALIETLLHIFALLCGPTEIPGGQPVGLVQLNHIENYSILFFFCIIDKLPVVDLVILLGQRSRLALDAAKKCFKRI